MKEFKEALKWMCSDEHGEFQTTEVIAGVGIALLIPMLWLFLCMCGAR